MEHLEALVIAIGKLNRADRQIGDLYADVRAFLDTGDYEVFSQVNADATEEVWKYRFKSKIPIEFSVRAGEILHNLRSPLDHLACAIAMRHSGSMRQTYFPFGADQSIFETEVRRKTKLLPPDAVSTIRALKPYRGGNDLLWHAHNLNRSDKHVPLLTLAVAKSMSWGNMLVEGGRILVMGSRYGQHMVTEGYVPAASAVPSADDQMEFMTTTPGAKVDADVKPTFHIVFNEAPEIRGRTAVVNLHHMHLLISRIVHTFELQFLR